MGDRAFVSDSAMMKAAIYQFFLQETRAVLEKLSKYWVLVTEFFQDTSNFSLYESEPQPCALMLEIVPADPERTFSKYFLAPQFEKKTASMQSSEPALRITTLQIDLKQKKN